MFKHLNIFDYKNNIIYVKSLSYSISKRFFRIYYSRKLIGVVNCIDNWRLEIVIIFISYEMKCCKCKKNYKLFNVKILN